MSSIIKISTFFLGSGGVFFSWKQMANPTLQLPVIDLSSSDRLSTAKSIRQVSFSHFHNIRPLVNLVLTKDYSRFVLVNFLILFWHVQEEYWFYVFWDQKVSIFFAPFQYLNCLRKWGFKISVKLIHIWMIKKCLFTCLIWILIVFGLCFSVTVGMYGFWFLLFCKPWYRGSVCTESVWTEQKLFHALSHGKNESCSKESYWLYTSFCWETRSICNF